MKKIIINGFFTFVLGALTPELATAQGTTTFLSNLEQTSAGSTIVAANSWVAATFFTGGNAGGYILNSIQLGMADASGNPSGFTVMLFGEANNPVAILPGSSLATLSGSTSPTSSGTYSYNPASSLTLSPGTAYFIVLTSGTLVANGKYEWSLSGINSYNPTGGWGVTGGPDSSVWGSANGSSWTSLSATYPQFAINATAAPEPGVVGLFALGGLLVAFHRRKTRPV
jgi:hypothetical protein